MAEFLGGDPRGGVCGHGAQQHAHVDVDLDDEESSGCVCLHDRSLVAGAGNALEVTRPVLERLDGERDGAVEAGDAVGIGWWLARCGHRLSVTSVRRRRWTSVTIHLKVKA